MDIDLERLLETFLAESEEDLAAVEEALLRLEKNPADREALALVFRKFHTLKGNALALGLERLGALAHGLEDLLGSLREGTEPVTQDLISFLLKAVDETRALLSAVTSKHDVPLASTDDLLARICDGHLRPAPADEANPVHDAGDLSAPDGASRTLRIDVGKLDELLNVTSEIAIARGRLASLIEKQGSAEIESAYRSMERLLTNLHRFVTNVRMVPLAPLLRHLQRVVRDLALAHGKRIELGISDQGVEVDTSVVEQLRGPLDQMIRNAVHHGIEAPDQRTATGKDPVGRITLRARHLASGIVIEVEDDGRGLDRGRILERARSLGIVPDSAELSDHDVAQLIFRQGLSTAEKVTSTSGRGVGMDVVLRNLNALGGSVDVASLPGEGTRITVRMPLTLAIIEGLLVGVADETFVLPLASVLQCVDLASALDLSAPDGVLSLRGRATPVMRLRSAFGLAAEPPAREVAVIVQKGDDQIGLVVDRLVGKAHVVVKPPSRFFEGTSALSGMTILGSGEVASILNVVGLVRGDGRTAAGGGASRAGGVALLAERPTAAEAPDRLLEYLTVFIGKEEYGLPLSRVEEIAALAGVTRVATAPAFVLGLLGYQGAAIPVIDVARKFDAQRPAKGTLRSIVIVQARLEGRAALVGLAVDRLGRLACVAASSIQPPPPLDGLVGVEFLTGVFGSDGRFVLCLDVDHILGTDDIGQVADLLHAGGTARRPAAEAPRLSFLAVHMAGEPCVLRLPALLEIVRPQRISRVPGAAPFVLGATNVRGTVVPVLDLARRCGLAAAAQEQGGWLVLVDAAGAGAETPVGLAVDDIDGLAHVPFDRIDRTPPFGTRFPHAWVEGMVPRTDTFVPILDVRRALSPGGDSSVLDPR